MIRIENRLAVWFEAIRPFSLTASVTPVLIGAAQASRSGQVVAWGLFPVFLLCAFLFHAATNLISDHVDYKKSVDRIYTYGSSGVLVQRKLRPEEVKTAAYALYAIGFLLGLFIVAERGWGLLLLGLAGMAGGYFYTVSPVGYKYRAFGDLGVFLFMGVLLVAGVFWALTGVISFSSFLVSLPISLLVTAILYANNVRDIKHDQEAGVLTLAGRLGFIRAKKLYYFFILAAYAVTVCLVFGRVVPLGTLAVFLTLPKAWQNISRMRSAQEGRPDMIATLDAQTAQLHLMFGLIFSAILTWTGRF